MVGTKSFKYILIIIPNTDFNMATTCEQFILFWYQFKKMLKCAFSHISSFIQFKIDFTCVGGIGRCVHQDCLPYLVKV